MRERNGFNLKYVKILPQTHNERGNRVRRKEEKGENKPLLSRQREEEEIMKMGMRKAKRSNTKPNGNRIQRDYYYIRRREHSKY